MNLKNLCFNKMNNKGQVFIKLILFGLGVTIFILASPILFSIINVSVGTMGTATAFVVKATPIIVFIILIGIFLFIISSGEGFFVP